MLSQNKISLNTSEGHQFFYPEEIIRLEANSNYTIIFFSNNKKLVMAKVLKEFALILEPLGFVRTHRTHLVNRMHIQCVKRDGRIIMKDSSVAEISRRLKGGVMRILKNAA